MLREEWTTGGQREESRTAGGVEDSGRSRGHGEESWTAGGVEDSRRIRGQRSRRGQREESRQWEELSTPGDIKKSNKIM